MDPGESTMDLVPLIWPLMDQLWIHSTFRFHLCNRSIIDKGGLVVLAVTGRVKTKIETANQGKPKTELLKT